MNKKVTFVVITTLCLFLCIYLFKNQEETSYHVQSPIQEKQQIVSTSVGQKELHKKKVLRTFQLKKQQIIASMPLKKEMQELPEAHHMPAVLQQQADKLGALKEIVIRYRNIPEIQREAADFYHMCADNNDYTTSIRTLCLYNHLKLAKQMGESVDISKYPLEIKKLVFQLKPF